MSYAGTRGHSVVVPRQGVAAPAASIVSGPKESVATANAAAVANCHCHSSSPSQNGATARCGCRQSVVTESLPSVSRHIHIQQSGAKSDVNGRPDFTRMTPDERLNYHRQRLGLGR